MSKSSTAAVSAQQQQQPQAQARLPSTHINSRSAWAKGPPGSSTGTPNTSSPVSTPRSQSPHPVQTHSRRTSSSFGIGVSTANVPRSFGQAATAGAAKNASSSPVTFGSIDQPSAGPTPASPPPVAQPAAPAGGSTVKSFGSLPSTATPNPIPPVNGKLPPPPLTSTTMTTSSATTAPSSGATTPNSAATPMTPTTATQAKARAKMDIKKLFQGGGSTASSTTPPPPQAQAPQNNFAPSPTPNPVPLPHTRGVAPQSYAPYSPSPSNLGRPIPLPLSPHPHPAALPTNQNQNGPPPHHQPPQTTPRSPSFNRQLSNGKSSTGPTTTPPNTSAPHSPRLIPQGPGPGNGVMPPPPSGTPVPTGMPIGQMGMQGMQQVWPQAYYYSPYQMPPQDPNQPQVHPNQHPHPHPQHPQYMAAPPQYQGMPVQWLPPHMQQHHPQHPPQGTPPQHLHPLPGGPPPPPTPQQQPPHGGHSPSPHLPHAQAHHPASSPRIHPPPLTTGNAPNSSHPASPSVSSPSISLPPPTPSGGARMNHSAAAFVPRKSTVIVIKDSSGKEIDFTAHKRDSSLSTTPTPIAEKRRSGVVRIETEEDKRKREEKLKEEERKKKEEEEKAKKEAEETERLKKEEEERERLRLEEEEKERIRREEEEKERIRKEKEKEKERLRLEEEAKERERLRLEEEEREKERIRLEEEKERLRKEEEEKERIRKEVEEREKERIRVEEEEKEKEAERIRLEKEKEEKEKAEAAAAAAAASAGDTPTKSSLAPTSSPVPPLTPPTPAAGAFKRRPIPGPLDLSSANRPGLPPPLPSALATARIIKDLEEVSYPEGIKSPKVELNKGAVEGKFRYDRDFLLQFMRVCKEKPDNLPPLDAIGLERSGDDSPASGGGHNMTRTRSERNRTASQNMGPPGPPNRAAIGLGIPGINQFGKNQVGGAGSGNRMGEFGTGGAGNPRHFTGPGIIQGGPNVSYGGGKPALVRTSSQGGPNGIPGQPGSGLGNRKRGSRTGVNRTEANRAPTFGQQGGQGSTFLEPVAPLETSANRWQAASVSVGGRRGQQQIDENSPEVVDRKVKSLLNKLTMERFDSISDQIIVWANKSEKETDGRTLMRVIRLVFEKATDEATWSEMYARLCRKMLEKISTDVVDESIKTPEGKPFAGGQLFRKYLLNRCQEDFERGWMMKEATSAAAAAKAADDSQAAANEEKGEEALYSEEYYASQKAKRQGLGLVKFIGELFKLQMLTERIMHECIKKLLSNVDNPAEEEIESLCKLLSTVGQQLDNQKAKNHMDVYFTRMKELAGSTKIASRMQYMLVDVIELRERRWQPRNAVAAPTTIAAVHEQAAREKVAADKESYGRAHPMSRGGSRRGEMPRGDNPDGWTTAGSGPNIPVRPPTKVGDMSKFGQITKGEAMTTFRPSGAFKKEKEIKRESTSLSRTNSNSNMYAALQSNEGSNAEPSLSRGSQPPSRKPSADFSQSGIPDGTGSLGRKRIQLLPRSVPVALEEGKTDKDALTAGDNTPDDRSQSEPEEGEIRDDEMGDSTELPPISVEEAERKVKEDVKELFSIRNLEEADEYFKALPSQHHPLLVEKIVAQVLDLKETDARFVASFFEQVSESETCAPADFEAGFTSSVEALDDISVDVPAAYKLVAILLEGSQLPTDAVERLADKIMVEGDPLVHPRQKLLKEHASAVAAARS